MKSGWKNFSRIAAFFLVLIVLLSVFGWYLAAEDQADWQIIRGLDSRTENSLDVVCVGSSGMFTAFNPSYAWELCGFTSYDYGTSTMPLSTFKYAIEEIQKTQNPQLYVVELETALFSDERMTDVSDMHRYLDSIPLSLNKLSLYVNLLGPLAPNAFFHSVSVHHYHYASSMDPQLLRVYANLNDYRENTNGCLFRSGRWEDYDASQYAAVPESEAVVSLTKTQEYYLRDFLTYCVENDLQVLFIFQPVPMPENSDYIKKQNLVGDIVQEYGYDFINYSENLESLGLVVPDDYYNSGHLNILGQKKFTEILSREIVQRIDIREKPAGVQAEWESLAAYYDEIELWAADADERGKELVVQGYTEYIRGED